MSWTMSILRAGIDIAGCVMFVIFLF